MKLLIIFLATVYGPELEFDMKYHIFHNFTTSTLLISNQTGLFLVMIMIRFLLLSLLSINTFNIVLSTTSHTFYFYILYANT